jgi:hypothetical protein
VETRRAPAKFWQCKIW